MSASVVSTIHLRIFSVFGLSVRHCLSTFGATSVISSGAILTIRNLRVLVNRINLRSCYGHFIVSERVHLTGTVSGSAVC